MAGPVGASLAVSKSWLLSRLTVIRLRVLGYIGFLWLGETVFSAGSQGLMETCYISRLHPQAHWK